MKFNKIVKLSLVSICSIIALASCGELTLSDFPIPTVSEQYQRPTSDDFNNAVNNFKTAAKKRNEELIKKYYDQMNDYLDYILDLRIHVSQQKTNLNVNQIGSEMTFLYDYYWTLKSKEVEAVVSILNGRGAITLENVLGEEKANEYRNISPELMFINRKYVHYSENHVKQYTDKIISYSANSINSLLVLTNLASAVSAMYDLLEAYAVCTIRGDIDTTDSYYRQELVYTTNLVYKSQNEYTKALITALKSPCGDFIKQQIGEEQAEQFLSSSVVASDQMLSLQAQETEKINEYAKATDSITKKNIYLDLINIRKNIFSQYKIESGSSKFSNYEDYIYTTSFGRDYSPSQALSLMNEIHTTFLSLWIESNEQYQKIDEQINENDLWYALSFVKNVIPDSDEVISYIKNHGLYSFDVSPNKYSGSYVIGLNNLTTTDYFINLGATGTINDYTAAIHEFGHYYSNFYSAEESTSNYQSLDLAEISSQALELLMMDYYNSFIENNIATQLRKNQLNNALWALFSGSAVSEFEHLCYSSTDTLSTEKLDEIWNSIKIKYNLENVNMSYEQVPHIYQSPGYYISYVTSMISSLEIWSQNKTTSIETYNKISSIGSMHQYLTVLNNCGLSNPFDNKELINNIYIKIDSLI